jgi:hypothetical protein
MNESVQIRRLVNGYQVSQAIHVAVVLGVPELLADGPLPLADLAERAGCQPRPLYRLLRALCSVGVYRELPEGTFEATALGDTLRAEAPRTIAGWALFVGTQPHWRSWSGLLHSVQTGESAFEAVHGQDVWAYRASHPGEGKVFDFAMTSVSSLLVESVLDAYDFGRFNTVVDVGGGRGGFLAAVLARHPALRGVVFDQPHVVASAPATLAGAGVEERCEVVAGDFFASVPSAGDAYVLKAVVHDWDDERATAILRTCRRDMPDTATLLLVERLLGAPNEGPDAAFSDLNMLVGPGGEERTEEEYAALLRGAGFALARTVRTDIEVAVLEARPA